MASTIWDVLSEYVLTHELRTTSADYYRRIASCFCTWYGGDVPSEEFTVDLVNRFLLSKQESRLTSAYRKSLRNGLRALLNHLGREGKLRPVKLLRFDPDSWTPEEICRIVDACPNEWWRQAVELAYYSGLSQCDLWEVTREAIRDGVLHWRRRKTGEPVYVPIPDSLLCRLPPSGLLIGLPFSEEWFRRQFAKIVAAAKLTGTFKKIRKSAGTSVESLYPGAGHLFLANSRKIFELHYMTRAATKHLSPAPLRQ